MLESVKTRTTYRNKKTGNDYYVLDIAKHSETQENMVVYVRLDDVNREQIWVRPLELFKVKFEKELKRR